MAEALGPIEGLGGKLLSDSTVVSLAPVTEKGLPTAGRAEAKCAAVSRQERTEAAQQLR